MSDSAGAAAPSPRFPLWPLLATMAMQTCATMAAYSVPALAPAIARDLGVDGALAGYFVSMVYGVGIASSLVAADLIHRAGAVRVGQWVVAAALVMLVVSASGSLAALVLGAVALGSAYGATAPVSTHLLVPRTPPSILNLVLSVRQIGVPLGGVLGAMLLPPLALKLGWQQAFLLQALPALALLVLLEWARRDWDGARAPAPAGRQGALRQLPALLRGSAELRRLAMASFVYSGVQLSFVAFTTVQLTSRAGFSLVEAGQALAAYQVSGVLTRPLWGWVADNLMPARWLLVLQGLVMALAALAAGHFGIHWSHALVLSVCALAGASASGYTGLAYAEFARLGGARRTEATGMGSAAMFTGVLVFPSLGAVLVTRTGSYVVAYGVLGAAAAAAAVLLATGARGAGKRRP
jgi:predicted MFS family arabinose efflux permease